MKTHLFFSFKAPSFFFFLLKQREGREGYLLCFCPLESLLFFFLSFLAQRETLECERVFVSLLSDRWRVQKKKRYFPFYLLIMQLI